MTSQLESDLRAALRGCAAELPATSVARLTRAEYRPRTGIPVGERSHPTTAGWDKIGACRSGRHAARRQPTGS